MEKITLLLFVPLICLTGFAQTSNLEVFYQYDNAGNRVKRFKEDPGGGGGANKWGGTAEEQNEAATPELTKEDYFKVYPNPNGGLFTIETSDKVQSVAVYDMNGRQVFGKDYFFNRAKRNIDLTSYPKGIYLVRVTVSEEEFFVERVVYE